MASTFNANEFANLINELIFSHMGVNDRLDAVKGHTGWAAYNYSSTDSNIGGTFSELTEILNGLRASCDDVLTKLQDSLTAYMNETIENETKSATEVQAENDALASIKGNLSGLI